MLTGQQACTAAFTGVGFAFGATAGGVTGGTMSVPAMIAGAGVGFICGKLVCRFPVFYKLFDKTLGLDAFEKELAQSETRGPVVAFIASELSIGSASAETMLDGIVKVVRSDLMGIKKSEAFGRAQKHPASGRAAHGLMVLIRTADAAATT